MAGFFNYLFLYLDGLGAYTVFALGLLAVAAVFSVAIILSVFVRGYSLKKRAWFIAAVVGISGVQLGLSLIFGYGAGFCVLTAAIGVILSIPVFTVRVREKTRKEHREFAKFIDGQIKRTAESAQDTANGLGLYDAEFPIEDASTMRAAVKDDVERVAPSLEKDKKSVCEIDFTHVKNVIARLEYFSLGASDRKQVKDLETYVYMAENGEYTPQLKSRINDGLGSLLKIMAKYGV